MKTTNVIALALVVIAANLTISTFRSSKSGITQQPLVVKYSVVKVIEKAATDYDGMGAGSYGFVVKDGEQLGFVEYDKGSMFDKMEMPKTLLIADFGENKKVITPLTGY